MPKSKIIKQLINGDKKYSESIDILFVLAFELNDENVLSWIEKERNGYYDDDIIPDYRQVIPKVYAKTRGIYSGYGNDKQPLSLDDIPENLHRYNVLNNISDLEKTKNDIKIDLNNSEHVLYNDENVVENCNILTVYLIIDSNIISKIVKTVQSKILKSFLELEKKFGCLDDFDLSNVSDTDKQEARKTLQLINNYNYNDCKIKNNNKNSNINNNDSNISTEKNLSLGVEGSIHLPKVN